MGIGTFKNLLNCCDSSKIGNYEDKILRNCKKYITTSKLWEMVLFHTKRGAMSFLVSAFIFEWNLVAAAFIEKSYTILYFMKISCKKDIF